MNNKITSNYLTSTKLACGEKEEIYDNFDPSKDRYEWSPMCENWQVEWDSKVESWTTELASPLNLKASSSDILKFDLFQKPIKKTRKLNLIFNEKNNKKKGLFFKCQTLKHANSIIKKKLKFLVNSIRFHLVVILLIIMNCLAISGEVITDYIERVFYYTRMTNESLSEFKSTTIGTALSLFEQLFKYLSLTILFIQVLEIGLKLAFSPRIFAQLLELSDLLLVFCTFALNFYLFNKSDHHVHSVTGLIIILR